MTTRPNKTRLYAVWQVFRKFRITALYSAMVVLAMLVAACEKPPEPAPVPPAPQPKPMILLVPGYGESNVTPLYSTLRDSFPGVNVINFGTGRNSYLADVEAYAAKNPHGTLITIGFSYGSDKVNQIIGRLGPVALDVKLDPVPEQFLGRYTITPNVRRTLVIAGDFSGLFRAGIDGPYEEMKVHRGHVDVPNDPRTMAIVRDAVREALTTP